MAQITLNDGELGSVWRDAVNDNFTELYARDGTNLGGEKEVFKALNGVDFEFRTLKEGTNITITQNTNDITFDVSVSPSRIEDADSDTYVDTESSSDVDIVEIGSPKTGSNVGFKFTSDTGGTPKDVFEVDGDGRISNDGEQTIRHYTSGTPTIYLGVGNDASGTSSGAVFIGENCGGASSGTSFTVAAGYTTGYRLTGDNHTMIGTQAGFWSTTGDYNTYIGRAAGFTNATGSNNFFGGAYAGYYQLGSNKIIFDSLQRADAATELIESPVVIDVNATLASQAIQFNAKTTISNDLTGDIFVIDDTSSDIFTIDNDGHSEQTGYNKATGNIRAITVIDVLSYNIDEFDYNLMFDGSGAIRAGNLPVISAANHGTEYTFTCIDSSYACSIVRGGSDFIGYTGSTTSVSISAGDRLRYQADNNQGRWIRID